MISFLQRTYALLDRPARLRFGLYAIGSIFVACLEAVAVALIVPLSDLLVSNGDSLPAVVRTIDRFVDVSSKDEAAAVLGVLVVLTFVVKGLAAIALLRWAIGNSLKQEARIARHMFASYLSAPALFHLGRNSAEIQRTFNQSLPLVFRRTVPFVMGSAADAFTLLGVVLVVLLADPIIAGLAVVYFVVISLLYQHYISGRQRSAAKRVHKEMAERYREVQEAVRATKEIEILHRHGYFIERFHRTKLALVDAQRVLVFYQLAPRYFLDLAFIVGGALVTAYAFAAHGTAEGTATVGLFLTASFRLLTPLNRMLSTVTLARTAEPAVDQIVGDLKELEVQAQSRADVSQGRLGPSSIELDQVAFRYDEADADVLREISLRIEPGEDIGLVGATGAGKTTLLNLVLGLFDATSGEVRVADQSVTECRTDWQLSIGYVPQEVVLIDDSIRTNLAFGVEADEIDEHRVAEALRMAQIDEFVASLPEGLDTYVGEAGVRLSGGQRQRIGIARALYHRPSVLVLDEATSALDSETEARIIETITALRGSLTLITVSHRLSTLKHCDRIYFLRMGHIAASGTFDELHAAEPEFAQLVARAQLHVGAVSTVTSNGADQTEAGEDPTTLGSARQRPFRA